jgi:hypothetical protein
MDSKDGSRSGVSLGGFAKRDRSRESPKRGPGRNVQQVGLAKEGLPRGGR